MPRTTLALSSFVSGEFSAKLDGRTDFEKYNSGCKTMENMLVHPQGASTRRVGTQFYLDKMIEELETMSAKDVGIVREKLHHYRWLASKLLPSLYGDKQEVVQDTKITIQWQQDPKIVEGQVVSAD